MLYKITRKKCIEQLNYEMLMKYVCMSDKLGFFNKLLIIMIFYRKGWNSIGASSFLSVWDQYDCEKHHDQKDLKGVVLVKDGLHLACCKFFLMKFLMIIKLDKGRNLRVQISIKNHNLRKSKCKKVQI